MRTFKIKTLSIKNSVMKLIDNKKDVSLSNNLVASKFHLTREEQNLVLLVASQISKYDEDFKDYKVTGLCFLTPILTNLSQIIYNNLSCSYSLKLHLSNAK